MKKLIFTVLLTIMMIASANAYTILANVNDLRRHDLQDEQGNMHFEWLSKISTGQGLNKTHSENPHQPSQWFTLAEKHLMYKYLGTDFVLQEECSFESRQYRRAIDDETGFVDAYMVYNECRYTRGFLDRFGDVTGYDINEICPKYDTTISPEQIEYTTAGLEMDGYTTPNYIILVRAYSGKQEKIADMMLEHPQVGGAMFEIGGPRPGQIDSSNIDRMIRRVIGEMGKQVFILITPHPDHFNEKPYEVFAREFVNTLRRYVGTELLNDDRLFLVVSNYGALRKNWFGKSDSVEAVTNELKSHQEWSGDDNEPTVFKDRESKHNGTGGCFINTLAK